MTDSAETLCKVVVLISGSGSNLQAIIDNINNKTIPAKIAAVVSDQAEAYGLTRARNANIATEVLAYKGFSSREDYDQALINIIDQYQPDLIVLAGFMRILSDHFVAHYMGRMMNIHPSLLPKFKGLNTHQRAIDAGEKEHGATVHFVIPELDSGPIIIQAPVPIEKNETPDSLAQKVHGVEHQIYPLAVKWYAEKRLGLNNNIVELDNQPITDADRILSDTP
ncbi:MAG: phosphoribosylglycinamide formyltransferase [Gammaproteobacteria bacterium]|nr:phosphoribosylglycinamide formyltransferase [Gammaproteobacteria bacterium]